MGEHGTGRPASLISPASKPGIIGGNMKRFAAQFVGLLAWTSLFAFPATAGIPQELDALKARVTVVESRLGIVEALAAALVSENTTQASQIAAQASQIAALQAEKLPVGTIITYTSETPPPGFLECDGSQRSRADYATLFAVVGTAFGAGDGALTFNLPDLRGRFLRGWAHGTGWDPDRNIRFQIYSGGISGDHVGSYQYHEVGQHFHYVTTGALNPFGNFNAITGGNAIGFATGYTEYNFGSETRPVNAGVMFAIKY